MALRGPGVIAAVFQPVYDFAYRHDLYIYGCLCGGAKAVLGNHRLHVGADDFKKGGDHYLDCVCIQRRVNACFLQTYCALYDSPIQPVMSRQPACVENGGELGVAADEEVGGRQCAEGLLHLFIAVGIARKDDRAVSFFADILRIARQNPADKLSAQPVYEPVKQLDFFRFTGRQIYDNFTA